MNATATAPKSAPKSSAKVATDAPPAAPVIISVPPAKAKSAMEILAELRAKQKAEADAIELQIKALETQAKEESAARILLIEGAINDLVTELNGAGVEYSLSLLSTHAREMSSNQGKLRPVSLGRTVSDGSRSSYTDAQRANAVELFKAGKTASEVSNATGIKIPSLNLIKAAAGLTKKR